LGIGCVLLSNELERRVERLEQLFSQYSFDEVDEAVRLVLGYSYPIIEALEAAKRNTFTS